MCNSNSFLLILAMVLLPLDLLFAQQLFFRHLGYEQGMNDLHSYHCTIDQNGFIWVATHEGIVRFNGKDITYYLHQTHPELPQDEISYVFCDSKNNIWASTRKGLVRIDEKRQLKRHEILKDSITNEVSSRLFEDGDSTIYAHTGIGMFKLEKGTEKWSRV